MFFKISEMKHSFSDLPSDWALSEDRVSELKDKSIEITKLKYRKKKEWGEKSEDSIQIYGIL